MSKKKNWEEIVLGVETGNEASLCLLASLHYFNLHVHVYTCTCRLSTWTLICMHGCMLLVDLMVASFPGHVKRVFERLVAALLLFLPAARS